MFQTFPAFFAFSGPRGLFSRVLCPAVRGRGHGGRGVRNPENDCFVARRTTTSGVGAKPNRKNRNSIPGATAGSGGGNLRFLKFNDQDLGRVRA